MAAILTCSIPAPPGPAATRDSGLRCAHRFLSELTLTAASRLDTYKYGDTSAGKVTHAAGLLSIGRFAACWCAPRIHPVFARPTFSYLYAGPSGSSSGGTDYYLCRLQYASSGPDYFDNFVLTATSPSMAEATVVLRCRTRRAALSPADSFLRRSRTSTSASTRYCIRAAAMKWSIRAAISFCAREADCLLGTTVTGERVDTNSPTCRAGDQ